MTTKINVPALDINQLQHLIQFFQIKERDGVDAAVEWAESVIAQHEPKEKAQTPKHLSLVS